MSSQERPCIPARQPATNRPFFIVGCGRSGSTLLRMMLTAHSRLTIPPETWYLLDLLKRFSFDGPLSAAEIESAVSVMTGHYRWPDMKLSAQEFRHAVDQLSQPCVRELAEVVYQWHMKAEGKARWGDKTPGYIEIVPELARMYPDSRFIHLIRDGHDVAKSFQVKGWAGSWLHDGTREWTRALECHWRWIRSELKDRILPVRYEKLVLAPQKTLQEICRFIGEELEPQMLSWDWNVDALVPARELKAHAKLKQKMGPESVARWKREMNARETFVAEAFMGTHLRRLGYERRFSGRLWRPAFAVTRLYCRAVLPALEWAIRVAASLRGWLRPRVRSRGCADRSSKS